MERSRHSSLPWLLVVCLALSAACSSPSNPDASDDEGNGGEGGGGSGGDDGAGGAGNAPAPSEACRGHEPRALHVPLARLGNREYTNSVRDLLPGVTIPELTLPEEATVEGFSNLSEAQTVSAALVEALAQNARAVATAAMGKLGTVLPCQPASAAEEKTCGETFIDRFGERAFRRPLTDAERTRFRTFFGARLAATGFPSAVSATLQAFLQTPQFLYRIERGEPVAGGIRLTGHELATRISYALWDSTPDAELLAAAGKLGDRAVREREVRRMIKDARARAAVAVFHDQWLRFAKMDQMRKDAALFPQFDEALETSMRTSAERFVDDVFWNGGKLAGLFTGSHAFVDGPLAAVYGVTAPKGDGLERVSLPSGKRGGGILTQVGMLAGFGHATMDAPVLRGIFVLDRLLCSEPPSAPADVTTTLPEPDPGTRLTTRQRFEQQHHVGSCRSCHTVIDGIGFGFSHYDAIGAWRDTDNGLPVDAKGKLSGTDVDGEFDGAPALGAKLAKSETVQRCVTRQLTRYTLGVSHHAVEDCDVDPIHRAFARSGFDLEELLVAVLTSDTFATKEAE